jgi:cyanophycin synthetase
LGHASGHFVFFLEEAALRILGASAFVGANVHAPFPVLLLRVELARLEDWPARRLGPGLLAGLAQALPKGPGEGGDGLGEVEAGGLGLARLLERTILGLQHLAGSRPPQGHTAFGASQPSSTAGVYEVAVGYQSAALARAAAELGCDLILSLLPAELRPLGSPAFDWREERDAFVRRAGKLAGDATTRAVLAAARRRGLPCFELGDGLLQLGQGRRARRFHRSSMPGTAQLAAELAADKAATHDLLAEIGLPVPAERRAADLEAAIQAAEAIGYPVVLKKLRGHRGEGYSGELKNRDELRRAFLAGDGERLVQALVRGEEHRLLVLGERVAMAALRRPARVTGDGRHDLKALVDEINRDPERGIGYEGAAIRLALDPPALAWLAAHGLSPQSVPKAGEVVRLRPSADWLLGGTVQDVTARLHPEWRQAALRACRMLGLEVAAVEIVTPDPGSSPADQGAILEIEAAPDFQPFLAADEDGRLDLGARLVERLAPPGEDLRIPVAAITGTNGKTTTALLLTHLLELAGRRTGTACSDGLLIGGVPVLAGDQAGAGGARRVFGHPEAELAVLEVGCGSLLRHGLGFDQADVAAVLNVGADHLGGDGAGQRGPETLEGLARVKRLVVEAARGFVVLNADDPFCLGMAEAVPAGAAICYVTTFEKHSLVREHLRAGGRAVVLEEGPGGRKLVLYDGPLRLPLLAVEAIPMTRGGRLAANVANALFATAIGWCLGLGLAELRRGLASFPDSFEACPGRFQLFEELPFKVLLDAASNPPAVEAALDFVAGLPCSGRRICVLGAPGDRRDEDVQAMARLAAGRFDRYYCRRDHDLKGRGPDEIPRLLREELLLAEIDPDQVLLVPEETQAVALALAHAQPGDLVAVFGRDVHRSWDQIVHFRPLVREAGPEDATLAMPLPMSQSLAMTGLGGPAPGAPAPGRGPIKGGRPLDPERLRFDAGD